MTQNPARKPANIAYELFITFASILAIANIALIILFRDETVESVIFIIDLFLCIIFFIDFLVRLKQAESKSYYFIHELGWADLLSSLPIIWFKVLRLFRILQVLRLIREYGYKRLVVDFAKHRAASTMLTVMMLILLLMEFGGIAIVKVEHSNPSANIKTGADAIWWVMVTITTVGYGDRYPVTNVGRLIGITIMIAGVAVFTVFSGYLAKFFVSIQPAIEESTTQLTSEKPAEEQAMPAIESNVRLIELQRLMEEQERVHLALKEQLAELLKLQNQA